MSGAYLQYICTHSAKLQSFAIEILSDAIVVQKMAKLKKKEKKKKESRGPDSTK